MKKSALVLLISTAFLVLSASVVSANGINITECDSLGGTCDRTPGGNCTNPGYFCHTEGGSEYCCPPSARASSPLGKITLPPWLIWTRGHPGTSGIALLINNAVRLIFIVASIGLFIMFLWGGLNYIMSQGDKARTEAARNIITYAIIGFAIVALSFAIMRMVEAFFGISIIGSGGGVSSPGGQVESPCLEWTGKSEAQCRAEHHDAGSFLIMLRGVLHCCPSEPRDCQTPSLVCVPWNILTTTECQVEYGELCVIREREGSRYCCPQGVEP